MDVERFHDSVPHDCLLELLARRLKDRRLSDLLADLIASHHVTPGVVLPIGDLTSQYLGNLYLDPFDHWLTEVAGVPGYVRYMDDMVAWGGHERLAVLAREAPAWIQAHLGLRVEHGGELNRCRGGSAFPWLRGLPRTPAPRQVGVPALWP